ncbi:MAG: rane protein involved in the export of O-antigen and teichoic acid [Clostridiaceae bacterium]|jgi:O-antigen/teichoic acid export membrane protein|nr:rane protein involved in the export of O-antigen and teichoic acid [Clostridiaceae bacterium]
MKALVSRKRKLFKDIFIYGFGMVSVKIFNFLFIPFLTKYIESDKFGEFDLISSLILLLIPLVTFEISDGIYRYTLSAKSIEEKSAYICNGLIVLLKGIGLSLITLIIIYLSGFSSKIPYLMYNYIWLVMAAINGVLVQIVRGLEKAIIYSINTIVFSISTIILNIFIVVFLNMGIFGLIVTNILGFLISNIFLMTYILLSTNISKNINKSTQILLIKFSAPLIFSTISWWVMNVSDRYLAAEFVGLKELGVYSMGNRFSSMLGFVYTIFELGWQTVSIKSFNSDDREEFYSKVFNLLALIMFSIVIFSLFFIKPFIGVFVSEEYFMCYRYIPLLLLAMVFNCFSSFYGIGYQAVKDTKGATRTALIACAVNIIINLIFMPKYGIYTAVISTFLAFLVMSIIRIIEMKDYFKVKIKLYNYALFAASLYSVYFLYFG